MGQMGQFVPYIRLFYKSLYEKSREFGRPCPICSSFPAQSYYIRIFYQIPFYNILSIQAFKMNIHRIL